MAKDATTPANGNGANLGFDTTLWKAADALRSNMDAAEYEHVVLGLIFLKYISDAFEVSPLGQIPKGWRVATNSDVADNPRRGMNAEEIDPSTPYIALEHMPRRSIALADWGTAAAIESNKFEFHRGENLFGKLRPYFH